jgi:hypothetical protein
VSKADECRAKAAECFEQAKLARIPHHRRAYEDIGYQWLALADQIERDDKKR